MTEDEVVQTLSQTALDIVQGALSAKQALAHLDMDAVSKDLSDALARGLSREMFRLGTPPQLHWQPAIALQLLLFRCLDVRAEPPAPPVLEEMSWNLVSTASLALWQVPDPSLYQEAMKRGKAAAETARDHGNPRGAGDLLHALGTLNLDPYGANRAIHAYDREMDEWRARAAAGETWDHARYVDIVADGYPDLATALQSAARFYREAAPLREGRNRALSLKALAQTLYHCHLHELPFDRQEMADAAGEALRGLDETEDPAVYAETQSYLRFAAGNDEAPPEGTTERWLSWSLDRTVERLGPEKTVQLVQQAYAELKDYPRLLNLLLDAAPLFRNSPHEPQLHFAVLRTFIRAQGVETYDLQNPPDEPLAQLHQQLLEQAREAHWDPARLAAGLLALADLSVALDQESLGIQYTDSALELAPLSTAKVLDSIRYVRALLLLNDGVNAVNHEEWNRSTARYTEALAAYLDAGIERGIDDVLGRINDVVRRGDSEAVLTVCGLLEARIDAIEVAAGDRVTPQLQSLLEQALRSQLLQGADGRLLWRLIQLSGARRFAAMLAAGSAYRINPRHLDPELLQRIHHQRLKVIDEGYLETTGDRLSDAILLSPYAVGSMLMMGDTAGDELANLEHRFDARLYEALVHSAEGSAGLLLNEEEVRATLGDKDVIVLYHYVDGSADGQVSPMLITALTTRDETRWQAFAFGHNPRMEMEIDGVPVVVTELSARVQALRETILEDPDGEPLSAQARASVESLHELLIAPIQAQLDTLRDAGKRHLCILPPGPLAYAPIHLLGNPPGTLFEQWTLSYLPTLQLLVHSYGGPALPRQRDPRVAAFGLSFVGNTLGYDELPESVEEAKAVASTMQAAPLLEAEATERRLLSALQGSRYVHVSTHGHQNPTSPSFHKLILTPEGDDDGYLNAYELLGLDLRGLELVTLSACETALGRFDRGMNPHGLPAMLLLAGAETVIGTLWEIEAGCSARFFTNLYTGLAQDKDKLTAYQEALHITREHHPEFRDWGAFYFVGRWS